MNFTPTRWRPSHSASRVPSPDGLPLGPRRWALAGLWLAVVMAVLDGAIANVALPSIAHSLDASPTQAIWIVNAYQLAIVVSLLPLSAIGQIVMFRRVFLAGLALFVLASLGCAFAQTLPELVLARTIQGFGAAGVMSTNGALLRFIFPSARLGHGVGLNALVVAVAAAVGPSVASAILAVASWPFLFAVNLPIGLAALVLGWFALPATVRSDHKLDLVATILNVAAFGLIITGASALARGDGRWVAALGLALGVAAALLLVLRSRRQAHPLLPVDLLSDHRFALAAATSVASFIAQMLAFIALPFLFQRQLHLDAVRTGLFLTAWPVAVGVAAPLAGRLADRFPGGLLGGIGLAMLAVGLFCLSGLTDTASSMERVAQLALCGCGFGLFQSPNNRALLSSAPAHRAGAAGAMLAVARLTGQTIGATLAALLFALPGEGSVMCLRAAMLAAALASVISLFRAGPLPHRRA